MKGTYKATIEDHSLANIGKNLTPAVKFKLSLSENLLTGEAISPVTVYYDGFLTDAACDSTLKTLDHAMEWKGNDINDFNGTGKFVGVEVAAVVDEEEYNGKVRTKVKFVNNINGVSGKLKPADSGIARGIAEAIKGKILAYRQKNPVSPSENADGF